MVGGIQFGHLWRHSLVGLAASLARGGPSSKLAPEPRQVHRGESADSIVKDKLFCSTARAMLGLFMCRFLRCRRALRVLKDEAGQTLIEYTLLLAFVVLGAAGLFIGSGQHVSGIWNTADQYLQAFDKSDDGDDDGGGDGGGDDDDDGDDGDDDD